MASIFEKAREGDDKATAELQRLVRAFARRVCSTGGPRGNADFDREDVAQEAMCRLLQSAPGQYRGSGSESSYVYTVVKCAVIQMARSAERRRRREETAAAPASPGTPTPDRRLDAKRILDRLETECRKLIERVLFRDEAYSTIAKELELTESSIRSRMHRCLNQARKLATEEEP